MDRTRRTPRSLRLSNLELDMMKRAAEKDGTGNWHDWLRELALRTIEERDVHERHQDRLAKEIAAVVAQVFEQHQERFEKIVEQERALLRHSLDALLASVDASNEVVRKRLGAEEHESRRQATMLEEQIAALSEMKNTIEIVVESVKSLAKILTAMQQPRPAMTQRPVPPTGASAPARSAA